MHVNVITLIGKRLGNPGWKANITKQTIPHY